MIRLSTGDDLTLSMGDELSPPLELSIGDYLTPLPNARWPLSKRKPDSSMRNGVTIISWGQKLDLHIANSLVLYGS